MDTADDELVRRAQAGERAALDELVARHLPALEAYVRARLGRALAGREGASDVVQSTCRDLFERFDDFRHGGEQAFRHWLYATAARKLADRLAHHLAAKRDRGRELAAPEASAALGAACADLASPSQQAMGAEFLARLELAFASLPEEEREVVLLTRVAGLARTEVAQAMGRSENGVRNLLHRALARLAERLDVEAGE